MREILYHGKRLDSGEWVEGFYLKHTWCGGFNVYIVPIPILYDHDGGVDCFTGFVEVDPSTVGQYTGLTDRNGKRIFEGDIVCIPVECMPAFLLNHYEVRWRKTNPGPGFALYRDDTFWDWTSGEIEVIGNIHDNPELLERGRE